MQEKDREAMLNPVFYARSGDFSRKNGWLFEGILRWKLLLRCKSWKNWMAIQTSFACPDPSSIGVGDLKSKNLAPQILAWLIVRCVYTQRNCSNLIMHGLNLESWHQSIGNRDFQKTYWGLLTWLVALISLASPTGWLIQSSTQDSGMLLTLYDLWFIISEIIGWDSSIFLYSNHNFCW
jgi:hypothetical protein